MLELTCDGITDTAEGKFGELDEVRVSRHVVDVQVRGVDAPGEAGPVLQAVAQPGADPGGAARHWEGRVDLVPVELQEPRQVAAVSGPLVQTDAAHLGPGVVRHTAADIELLAGVHHLDQAGQGTPGVAQGDVDSPEDHLGPGVVAERVLPGGADEEELGEAEHDGQSGSVGTVRSTVDRIAVLVINLVVVKCEGKFIKIFQIFLLTGPAVTEEVCFIKFLQVATLREHHLAINNLP